MLNPAINIGKAVGRRVAQQDADRVRAVDRRALYDRTPPVANNGRTILAYGRNDSGADLKPFDYACHRGILYHGYAPGNLSLFRLVTPATNRWNLIAVAQQYIPDGGVGLVAVGGICVARVLRDTPYDTNEKIFANITVGDTAYLTAGNVGPVRLLDSTPFEVADSPVAGTGLYEVMLTYPIDPQCTVKLVSNIARGKYYGRTFSYAASVSATGDLSESSVGAVATADDSIVINPAEISTSASGVLTSVVQPILRATQRGIMTDGKVVLEVAGYPLEPC